MKSNYKPIGEYIRQIKIKNTDGVDKQLLGINIDKYFMPSVANVVGTDLTKYKIVKKKQFACNRMHVGRDKRLPVALSEKEEDFIVSPAYDVFEITDKNVLLPEYLMMWFSRKEFDRNAWFYTDADVRGGLHWDAFCNIKLPVPSIEKQREIVKEYNTIVNRIKLNEELNKKLEETAQAIYKQWFVDFEFPDENGKPYKSSGGAMVWCDELGKEIPEGWSAGQLSNLASYSSERVRIEELNIKNYISTENMLPNRGGITIASSLPAINSVTKFSLHEILISNIRPYFKKIWHTEFDGGCSNDILCLTPNENTCSFYLYHSIVKDSFFDYVMNGSKGTKMPRGDKVWIMNYPILIPNSIVVDNFKRITLTCAKTQSNKNFESDSLLDFSTVLLSKMAKA